MLARLGLLLIMCSLSACATVEHASPTTIPLSAQPTPPSGFVGIEHTVQRGETLWRISRMYQTDLDEILRINNIPDSAVISVGQKIYVPRQKTETATAVPSASANDDFLWPAKGEIVAHFKEETHGIANKGIDIRTSAAADITASQDGAVVFVGKLPGYGETVIVDHRDGLATVYSGAGTVSVKDGDEIKRGSVIAKTADKPLKGQDILHFEIRRRHKPQNPLYYLD